DAPVRQVRPPAEKTAPAIGRPVSSTARRPNVSDGLGRPSLLRARSESATAATTDTVRTTTPSEDRELALTGRNVFEAFAQAMQQASPVVVRKLGDESCEPRGVE